MLKLLSKIFFLFTLLAGLLWGAFIYQINQPLALTHETLLTIKPGTSISSFSRELVEKDWINTRFWLRNYVRIHKELAVLKAGTYLIKTETTSLELLKHIVAGREHQFSITFIEGTTFKQWLALIHQHPYIKKTIDSKNLASFKEYLKLPYSHLEGLFFPDTYAFTYNTSDKAILKQAYEKMQYHLTSLWETKAVGLPYKTSYDALIMASIIEKETAQKEEYPLVASVFVNRLRKNMRLQTDPTVIYGLGERYKGDITRVHLKEKNAYNTYRIKGLPLTPIAMAGKGAIKAALHPEETPYLYFVSEGNGYHKFSTNLKDHNKAVKAYLKKTGTK